MWKLLDVDYIAEQVIDSIGDDVISAIARDVNAGVDELTELCTIKGFFKALFNL